MLCKEHNNPLANGVPASHEHAIDVPQPLGSAPYVKGGQAKNSPWLIALVVFSTILGIVGLILGAYATAEVNSISHPSFRVSSLEDMDGFLTADPTKTVSGFSLGGNIVGDRGLWVTHPDLDLARSDAGAVSFDDKIYMFGGLRLKSGDPPGEVLNTLVMYDPATKTHSQLANMPDRRYRMAYALLDGKIYVFGGLSVYDEMDVEHSAGSTMVYDIAGDSWEDLSSTDNHLNVLRSDACGAAANGKVYAFGGYEYQNSFNTTGAIEEFDPATGSWTRLDATLARPRGDCKAVTVDGMVYVLGGAEYNPPGLNVPGVDCADPGDDWAQCYVYSNATEMFNPATSSVTAKADMIMGRGDTGVAATPEGNIMVAGGETSAPSAGIYRQLATDTVEEYNVMTNSWRSKAHLPAEKFRHAMATANGKIFTLGGHPSCTEGIEQCMQQALDSVVAFHTFLGIQLRDN